MIKKLSEKKGMPPGSLIYIGNGKEKDSEITIYSYNSSNLNEKKLESISRIPKFDDDLNYWININGVHNIDVISEIGEKFGLHSLVLEDILNTQQRSKFEVFEKYDFTVIRTLKFSEKKLDLKTSQISLILGKNYVISFQDSNKNSFQDIIKRLSNEKSKIRKNKSDFLFYSLIDVVTDYYFEELEDISDIIENIEEKAVADPTPETLKKIRHLKRTAVHIRKTVWSHRETVNKIIRSESPFIHKDLKIYLNDLYEHIIQIMDMTNSLSDMLSGILDIYLSSVSNKMNQIMQFLTIVGTIFIPLTFAAGIYGMNFKYMPELEFKYSYPIFWIFIVTIGVIGIFYFKKKKWL